MSYRFIFGDAPSENLAEYEFVSDVQNYYMKNIEQVFPLDEHRDLMDLGDIYAAIMEQLFVHEALHQAIENVGMDTIADSQHETVYEWICDWMKRKSHID